MSRFFTSIASLAVLIALSSLLHGAEENALKAVDHWEVYYMQGSRIGYGHYSVRSDVEKDIPVLRVELFNRMSFKRANQTTTVDISCSSVESPEGKLLRYESELLMSKIPLKTLGRVHDGKLDLEITSAGAKTPARESIAWSADCGGPMAVEQWLLRKPMSPGDTRVVKFLMIDVNQPAKMELTAKQYESTALLNGSYELLRIDTVVVLPDGQKMKGTIWTNRAGDTLKNKSQAMDMTSYRVTKAEAIKQSDAVDIDLVRTMMVKIEKPLPNSQESKQVRYRIHLKDGDPASAFVTGPTQSIKSIDANTAEITVFAIRPGQSDGNRDAPADPPTEDDLRPNNLIQSGDPRIVEDAKKAAGDEKDPWRVAVALENYVHREVKKKDFSQAFASASEVAKSLEGDCTEHAVFLAALARARGIPARVASGLVYIKSQQAFLYHLWTEVYIEGRWIPIDGTLALGGIGAAHLKIAQHNLKGASAYSAFVPVLQVAGQLQIEILDAQ